MKNELLYENQTDFTDAQGNSGNVTSITPGVAYVIEEDKTGFNKTYDDLIVTYKVTDTSTAIKIYNTNSVKTNLKEVIVGKQSVPVSSLTSTYRFQKTGITKVIYRYSSLSQIPDSAFTGCVNISIVKIPESVTRICQHAFNGCSGLKRVKFPSKLERLDGNAFINCTSLYGTVTVPSTVTTVGTFAFGYCSGITDLIFESTATIPNLAFSWSGKASLGTLYIGGSVGAPDYNGGHPARYKKVIIKGSVNAGDQGRQYISSSTSKVQEIRVGGDMNGTHTAQNIVLGSGACVKFCELMGKFTGQIKFVQNNNTLSSSGAIMHLGNTEIAGTPTLAQASLARLRKIYVGPGESQEGDQEVLDKYLANSAWASYSSKLDLWYNYTGEYKE